MERNTAPMKVKPSTLKEIKRIKTKLNSPAIRDLGDVVEYLVVKYKEAAHDRQKV